MKYPFLDAHKTFQDAPKMLPFPKVRAAALAEGLYIILESFGFEESAIDYPRTPTSPSAPQIGIPIEIKSGLLFD